MVSRFRLFSMLALATVALSGCGDKAPTPATGTPATAASATTPAVAAAPAAPLYVEGASSGVEGVKEKLKAKYPTLTVGEVKRLNIPGNTALFEFVAGQQTAYTNEQVDFLLVGGELLTGSGDTATNVTERTAGEKLREASQTIPKEGGIEFVYGNGQREVTVFTDPDCPYCQALEFMFEANKTNLNAKITILPYPIDSLHPQADAKSRYILCTANPSESWHSWMLASANALALASGGSGSAAPSAATWNTWAAQHPSTAGCERAKVVDRALAYGRKYGFNQTPILMFSNGMPFLGLLDRTELEKSWKYVQDNPHPGQ